MLPCLPGGDGSHLLGTLVLPTTHTSTPAPPTAHTSTLVPLTAHTGIWHYLQETVALAGEGEDVPSAQDGGPGHTGKSRYQS